MRDVHTVGSTQAHRALASPSCVALAGTDDSDSSFGVFISLPLPCPAFAPRPLRRFIARMGALTPDRLTGALWLTDGQASLLLSRHLLAVRLPITHDGLVVACALCATSSLSVPGFASFGRLATVTGRIEFTHVADQRFTSSCSPPRLATTQFLLVSDPRARIRGDLHPMMTRLCRRTGGASGA